MHSLILIHTAKVLSEPIHTTIQHLQECSLPWGITTCNWGLFKSSWRDLRRNLHPASWALIAGTPSVQQAAPSPSVGVGSPRRPHVIRPSLRRGAVLRGFALRTPPHDVVRRGWLAAILLLFLARYLPLEKEWKCFGGLSIRSFGSLGPRVLPAVPYP